VVNYTIETIQVDERVTQLVVTFENDLAAETSVIGNEEQARWYAEQAFIPDLQRNYPELRGAE
jgi:hypothetical protein